MNDQLIDNILRDYYRDMGNPFIHPDDADIKAKDAIVALVESAERAAEIGVYKLALYNYRHHDYDMHTEWLEDCINKLTPVTDLGAKGLRAR